MSDLDAWDRFAAAALNAHCREKAPASAGASVEAACAHLAMLAASSGAFADAMMVERKRRIDAASAEAAKVPIRRPVPVRVPDGV